MMRRLIVMGVIVIACAAAATAPGWANLTTLKMPFEEIGLFEPLPAEVQAMPPSLRLKWIKAYNETAILQAQRRADSFRARNPVVATQVQDQGYTSQGSLDQNANSGYYNSHVSAQTKTTYQGRSTQRTYRPEQYGGGPVVLINPYTTGEVTNED